MPSLRTIVLTLSFSFGAESALSQELFLEGFGDFPLLEGVSEAENAERFVFDTPAGTVAATTLKTDMPAEKIIALYFENLPAFGWNCQKNKAKLKCGRETSLLNLNAVTDKQGRTFIRVQLEPNDA